MTTADTLIANNISVKSSTRTSGSIGWKASLTLDKLVDLSPEELNRIYQTSEVPNLEEVVGDLRGRMLAAVIVPEWVLPALRSLARASFFPWRGKSFSFLSEGKGEGINRIFSDINPSRWFKFGTFVGRSRAGDFDAVQLDYDRPTNPWFIRAIKDEIREVRPGLYLGQAYFKTSSKDHLVLYFGLALPGSE